MRGKSNKNYSIFVNYWSVKRLKQMKRIRLDIGALAASPQDGGSFTFFLYREGMDRCLPVPLTPPEMHTALSNFKHDPDGVSIHSAFAGVLQQYRIELLEVTIIREKAQKQDCPIEQFEDEKLKNGVFLSELLFFDGEREVRQVAGFIDGIILSKQFGAPIYIAEELMDKYSAGIDSYSKEVLNSEAALNKLKEALQEAINNEEYERASQISKQIEAIKKQK